MILFKLVNSKFTLQDLENMLPWERDVYVHMILNSIKEDIEKQNNG